MLSLFGLLEEEEEEEIDEEEGVKEKRLTRGPMMFRHNLSS